ncbi:glycosyltransferase family 25 protein [Emticicia sp. SJ17W-69]|uniref:glycosyltransferase family 25 protein n=1 Tax=Emticicia sp. SJ17W-69 TaxID=3421657 RepID=UPI003EBBBDF5
MIESLFKKGIFVIHALKGYEYHEKRIIELFAKNDMSFEFVTNGDPIYLNDDVLGKYFVSNIKSKLSVGVVSCTLNHIYALERILAENLEYGLIFENDPFFLGNFTEKLKKVLKEMETLEKGFIISLENTSFLQPSFWDIVKGKYLYQASKCRQTGAYLIDRKGALNILNDLKVNKCNKVVDWWHDELIARNVIKMYWAYPSLVEEGSHNGHLSSTISSQNRSRYRRFAWNVQKIYKMYIRRLFPSKFLIKDK